MCQRQSSSPILPSAAAMPPCAATVCERVGNTLVMHAVRRPASLHPTTPQNTKPASTNHDDVVAMILNRIGATVHRRRAVRFSIRCHASDPERELKKGIDRG